MVITGPVLLELFLKWVVPFLCMAVVSWVTYLIAKPKKIYKKGAEAMALEEWEELAKKSNLLGQFCSQNIAKLQADSEAMDEKILNKLESLSNTIECNKHEAVQKQEAFERNLDVMREGILDAHLINLIYTCENYIRRGYITPGELDRYKQRLTLYHKLGGNGHMDYWDDMINHLPHSDSITGHQMSGPTAALVGMTSGIE